MHLIVFEQAVNPYFFQRAVNGAIEGGLEDDGLMQRFQLIVYSDMPPFSGVVDRKPDEEAWNRALRVHDLFGASGPEWIRASDAGGRFPVIGFDTEAQDAYIEWLERLNRRLGSAELEPYPAFEAHLGKLKGLCPILAMIFHLVKSTQNPFVNQSRIEMEALQMAFGWMEFLEAHAKRIYAEELNSRISAGHALARCIEKGMLEDGTKLRDISRAGWAGLNGPDATELVHAAVQELEGLGWLRVRVESTGGRPSKVVRINPAKLRAVT